MWRSVLQCGIVQGSVAQCSVFIRVYSSVLVWWCPLILLLPQEGFIRVPQCSREAPGTLQETRDYTRDWDTRD